MSTTARHPLRRIAVVLGVVMGLLVITVALVLGGRLLGDAHERQNLGQFYDQPAGASLTQGTLIKSEELEGSPINTRAWRIMYATRDLNDQPVIATGIVVTPKGDGPAQGRTVLAWGHPTTGTAKDCAPSRSFDPFIDIEGMRPLLDRGYTVVATDYVGMGTDGPNSYLIGKTAGNSVLDSVRAASDIPEAHASDSVILWGHSQGGQAVLFAAQQAEKYAPELHIKAVAAAAPAADLTALMKDHLDDVSGVTIGSYAFAAFSETYSEPLDSILSDEAITILPQMNELCLLNNLEKLHQLADPFIGEFTKSDPSTTEPWATLLADNSVGSAPINAPVFIAQGSDDKLVLPKATEQLVATLKDESPDLSYYLIERANHGSIAYLAIPSLIAWLDGLGV